MESGKWKTENVRTASGSDRGLKSGKRKMEKQFLGYAHLFAVKLCFTDKLPKSSEALPRVGGGAAKDDRLIRKAELFRK